MFTSTATGPATQLRQLEQQAGQRQHSGKRIESNKQQLKLRSSNTSNVKLRGRTRAINYRATEALHLRNPLSQLHLALLANIKTGQHQDLPTSRFTRNLLVAKVWQNVSDLPYRPSALTDNLCSVESTQQQQQQQRSRHICNICFSGPHNRTFNKLELLSSNTTHTEAGRTNSFTSSMQQQASAAHSVHDTYNLDVEFSHGINNS